MSTSKTILQLGVTTLFGAALLFSGCAEPASDEATEASVPQESSIPAATVAHAKEEIVSQHELIGVWWGTGVIDQEALARAVDGLSDETRRQVSVAAESFQATEMAIEFKADGQMETADEVVNKNGQRESGMGVATWEASPTINGGEYRVSSVETQADGSNLTDNKTYRVSSDGRQLTLLVDLPGLVGQCNPRIVLERQESKQSVAGQGVELR